MVDIRIDDFYKKELNPRNPLSHNGDVARAYAALLKELYGENTNSSFSPRSFKQVIGKYGPSFSGYGQQDSQEFLLFLLDGLQEDLNRIHKKPYIEKPDSTDEMVNNPAALAELAEKSWAIYKARNDSVITDLFAGMYKSTVVCPVCDKVSIIFDPFNNLTLQLPSDTYSVWQKMLFIFPLWSRPFRIDVDIDKNSSFAVLKEYVGKKTGIDPRRMVIAEIYKHRFFKVFNDKVSVSDERLSDGDVLAIFELDEIPTNYPPPKRKVPKYRSMLYNNNSDEDEDLPDGDSPLADQMLVAVFNRYSSGTPHDRFQKRLFGVPSYITLTKEEAKDYDSILRKVLGRVATMTTEDILRVDEEASDTESTRQDSDTVFINTDDTDSSSDSKVKAKSVQSEDGMLDVTMNDAEEAPSTPHISYPPQPDIHRRVSRLIQPGEQIDPDLRRMFDMKYFSGSEMIPTGWNALQDENRDYPSIASRIPQQRPIRPQRTIAEQLAHRIKHGGSGSSSDDEADDPPPSAPNLSSMQVSDDELDASDDGLPEVEELIKPGSSGSSRSLGKKLFRKPGLITYSLKGKNRFASQNNVFHGLDGTEEERNDDGDPRLLRLGEAIILDWTKEAHDFLFWEDPKKESVEDASGRARPTWNNVPEQKDPELDKSRQIRNKRRANGVSLDDCLDEFGKSEILSQDDAWYCPRCKEHRRASKKFELWKSPDILIVHLKRFSNQGRMRDKLEVFVDFPVEGLDLTSRLAVQEPGKSQMYDLFAVDNHYGGMGGGHYTAYAKNFYDNNWYEYNGKSTRVPSGFLRGSFGASSHL
jgi:ubiquitin carboxyl-terminal hydrolase 4/11/15